MLVVAWWSHCSPSRYSASFLAQCKGESPHCSCPCPFEKGDWERKAFCVSVGWLKLHMSHGLQNN